MIRIKDPELNSTTRTFPRTLQEAFPAAPEWHDYHPPMDSEDFTVTVGGLACLGFVLIIGWLGH